MDETISSYRPASHETSWNVGKWDKFINSMQNAIAKKPNTDIAKSPCRSIWKSCDSKLKQYTLHLYTSEMGVFSPGTLTKSKLVGLRNSSSWFQLVFPTFLKIKNVFGVQIHFLFSQTPPQKKKLQKLHVWGPLGTMTSTRLLLLRLIKGCVQGGVRSMQHRGTGEAKVEDLEVFPSICRRKIMKSWRSVKGDR